MYFYYFNKARKVDYFIKQMNLFSLPFWSSYLSVFHRWNKIPDPCNLNKRFILAPGLRGFSPQLSDAKTEILWQKEMAKQRCLPHGIQERAGEELKRKRPSTKHSPKDHLP